MLDKTRDRKRYDRQINLARKKPRLLRTNFERTLHMLQNTTTMNHETTTPPSHQISPDKQISNHMRDPLLTLGTLLSRTIISPTRTACRNSPRRPDHTMHPGDGSLPIRRWKETLRAHTACADMLARQEQDAHRPGKTNATLEPVALLTPKKEHLPQEHVLIRPEFLEPLSIARPHLVPRVFAPVQIILEDMISARSPRRVGRAPRRTRRR